MDYFKSLTALLQIEKEENRRSYQQLTEKMPVTERRANGMTWYPVAIKDTEIGSGDYLTVDTTISYISFVLECLPPSFQIMIQKTIG
jgi:hypothetical protein